VNFYKSKKFARGNMEQEQFIDDPPPINEEDINKGMYSLLNKGFIPKDVDLTPAFNKGAPPVNIKGARFYDKKEATVKREIQTGTANQQQTIKFDLQPLPQVQTRALVALPRVNQQTFHESNLLALPYQESL